jgi:ethanolamine-phosphate cytidylyltransferase
MKAVSILGVLISVISCTSIHAAELKKEADERIVYVDGVFDIAHYGHARSFEKAKAAAAQHLGIPFEKVKVLVGVCDNDGNLKAYKREPIMNLEQRVAQVKSFKTVDGVISNAPMAITTEFMDEQGIDLVMHGNDFTFKNVITYYLEAVNAKKYQPFPYEQGISTTTIVNRATRLTLEEFLEKEEKNLSQDEQSAIRKTLELLAKKNERR